MTSNDHATIGEMCKEFDVTPRTLRFYESKELLSPLRIDQKRLYSKREKARLTLILRGKRFGFSLEDIRQLLDLYNPEENNVTQISRTLEAAQDRLAAMEAQRAEMDETITDLREMIATANLRLKAMSTKTAAE